MRLKLELASVWMAVLTACISLAAGCDGGPLGFDRPPLDQDKPSAGPKLIVTPDTTTITLGGSRQLSVTHVGADGTHLATAAVSWSSSDTTRATVSKTGHVYSVYPGLVKIVATMDGLADTATVAIVPIEKSLELLPASSTILQSTTYPLFARSPGYGARTRDWRPGELQWTSSDPSVAKVDSMGVVEGLAPGAVEITVSGEGLRSTAQLRVLPPVQITSISVGGFHTCAVTSDRQAVCWGRAAFGALGVRTAPTSCNQYGCDWQPARFPLPVTSPAPVSAVTASDDSGLYISHTCALTESGQAVCWGSNKQGELGTAAPVGGCSFGSYSGSCSYSPVYVDLEGSLIDIGTGLAFSCGLARTGEVYCWGSNDLGKSGGVGGGIVVKPNLLSLPRSAVAIAVGATHACALDTSGQAYCWGSNSNGQLGSGSMDALSHPAPVAAGGALGFSAIAAGYAVTCGLTSEGQAHCWGTDPGGLQAGALASREQGMAFRTLEVYWSEVCAIDRADGLYCWGKFTTAGPGGVRTDIHETPTSIAPGVRWRSISLGGAGRCGISFENVAYCWQGGEPVRVGGQKYPAGVRLTLPQFHAATDVMASFAKSLQHG